MDFIRIINFYLPLLRAGDVVSVGGHGSKISLDFSLDSARYRSRLFLNKWDLLLDISDEDELKEAIPADRIAEGVHLFLESCSNAEGGNEADNMMNMMFRAFRERWHVYAMDKPNNPKILFWNNGYEPEMRLQYIDASPTHVYHKEPTRIL